MIAPYAHIDLENPSRQGPAFGREWLDGPVHARFEHIARARPEAIACRDRNGVLSYGALSALSRRIGAAIAAQVPPGTPVALGLEVDRTYPAAMLGALAAGRPYIPLDLSFPAERLRHILAHSGTRHVLANRQTDAAMSAMLPAQTTRIVIDDLPEEAEGWTPTATADDVAYIIYTSGSTGQPKGVYQSQRGLLHDVMQYSNTVDIRSDDVLTGLYSPSVGGAVRDIYGALLNGAALFTIDLRTEGLGAVLEAVRNGKVTLYHSMPPIVRALLRQTPDRSALATVRLVYIAGDKLFPADLALLRQHFGPDTLFYTGIGSTECATLYRHWFIPADWPTDGGKLPVGGPVPDRDMMLIGTNGEPVPVGETGEITVASRYIALGYWNDEAQTRSRFFPDPEDPQMRRYHTGDLGQLREDGLLEFAGRADQQVKIRGYRVEPQELEATLRIQPEVQDAAVIIRQPDATDAAMIAYVVLAADAGAVDLRQRMAALLPAYLCPDEIHAVPSLPTLGNFKTDYAALRAFDADTNTRAKAAIATSADAGGTNDTAAIVRRLWRDILKLPGDEETGFAAAGGDSLKALELHLALENALGVQLPTDWLSDDLTPGLLAQRIGAYSPQHKGTDAPQAVLFWNPGARENVVQQVVSILSPYFDVRNAASPAYRDEGVSAFDISFCARFCVDRIVDETDPARPLVLIGTSWGSRVAHDVATLLAERGRPVDLLVIGDIAFDLVVEFEGANEAARREARYMRLFLRRVARRLFRTLENADPDAPLIRDRWIDWAYSRLERQSAGSGLAQAIAARLMKVLLTRFIYRWRPRPFGGKALLLRSAETRHYFQDQPDDLGWRPYCPDLAIADVEGHHRNYFVPPRAVAYVQAIRSAVPAAEGQTVS